MSMVVWNLNIILQMNYPVVNDESYCRSLNLFLEKFGRKAFELARIIWYEPLVLTWHWHTITIVSETEILNLFFFYSIGSYNTTSAFGLPFYSLPSPLYGHAHNGMHTSQLSKMMHMSKLYPNRWEIPSTRRHECARH